FYVQYAHARTHSVFRNAAADMPDLDTSEAALAAADLSLLSTPEELELIRALGAWPRQVAQAAKAYEPHRIAFYLHELAALFHAFGANADEYPGVRFVHAESPTLTLARLALVDGVRQVLGNGLGLLGVSASEELSYSRHIGVSAQLRLRG